VRYAVQATRVGKMTNYDKLVLEVWTNGTMAPEMALLEAAKIYRKHLNPFVMPGESGGAAPAGIFAGLSGEGAGEAREPAADQKEILLRPISSLDLSVRAANCMKEEGISTVGELARRSTEELLALKNFGKTSLKEVEKKLTELGLDLGMDVDAVLKS
jgi:DNA-directed RNA polymerase subunit alpha